MEIHVMKNVRGLHIILVLYRNLKSLWLKGRKLAMADAIKTYCPPHRSHNLYPGPRDVLEKHFSLVSFHSASEKFLIFYCNFNCLFALSQLVYRKYSWASTIHLPWAFCADGHCGQWLSADKHYWVMWSI